MATKKEVKKALIRATQTLFSFIVTPLMRWADENKDAFFFLVIGNKHTTEVAWANTDDLQTDGAFTIGSNPKAACAFLDMECGVDIFVKENVDNKEKGFGEEFMMHSPSKDERGWIGFTSTAN